MTKIITCKECGKEKPHAAKGLCKNCYQKQYKSPMIICSSCGEEKQHVAKGLCRDCYNEERYKDTTYRENDRLVSEKWRRANGGLSYKDNKECSSYGGLITEELLCKYFKDVTPMPYGHRGYDFLCTKGYRIDAKSTFITTKNGGWYFLIKKNKNCDYFACVAFDNRDSMTPIHFWLIPAELVNDKVGISFSEKTLHKYENCYKPIDKVTACCDVMKEGE